MGSAFSIGALTLIHNSITSADVADLNPTAGTNFSAAKDNFYWIDVPSCNTIDTTDGNVRVDLPGSPTAGDRIGIGVGVQATAAGAFAQAPGFCVELNPGAVKINGESYTELNSGGSEKWGLWLNGESVVLQYINATVGWAVEQDHRRAHNARADGTGGDTFNASSATYPVLTAQYDAANLLDTGAAKDQFDIKRAGVYVLTSIVVSKAVLAADDFCQIIIQLDPNGTPTNLAYQRYRTAKAATRGWPVATTTREMSAADTVSAEYQHDGTNTTFDTTENFRPKIIVQELL